MAQLFLVMATINFLALLATFFVGVLSAFVDHGWFVSHFTLGLFTAIGTLLVHCIIFTYFLGTGRWVKEVSLIYHLPDEGLPKMTRALKRSSFPAAMMAMLVTIAASAAGAGVQLQAWPWYVHGSLGITTLLVNLWAYYVEWKDLTANIQVLDQVLVEVDKIRLAQGLRPNAEALNQN